MSKNGGKRIANMDSKLDWVLSKSQLTTDLSRFPSRFANLSSSAANRIRKSAAIMYDEAPNKLTWRHVDFVGIKRTWMGFQGTRGFQWYKSLYCAVPVKNMRILTASSKATCQRNASQVTRCPLICRCADRGHNQHCRLVESSTNRVISAHVYLRNIKPHW